MERAAKSRALFLLPVHSEADIVFFVSFTDFAFCGRTRPYVRPFTSD